MNAAFHKISIDFEYLNEIYTINSDPYKTLSELKDIVLKKIFHNIIKTLKINRKLKKIFKN